ncbi:MAG: hypothetical protein KME17_20500 [Cyanosarcina radialis HA8281-LM2]|nr:hypothetical protein [Cyanosarcina radialis HA8281-LM2]
MANSMKPAIGKIRITLSIPPIRSIDLSLHVKLSLMTIKYEPELRLSIGSHIQGSQPNLVNYL